MQIEGLLISQWMALGVIALAAMLVSGAILFVLLKTGLAWRLATDVPNERSLHVRLTPRVGGWSIVPVAVVSMLAFAPSQWCIALGTVLVAAISQIDDRRGLPARARFTAHLIAVLALVVVFPADVPWWWLGVIAFLMLWLVNLYNFMDGADGLAGGMAVFGFAAYAVAALSSVHPMRELAWGSGAIIGAAIGFLLFNFHPARIFLGDAGSISLGFMAGAFGYWGWRADVWPVWFPAMVFAPFIVDASVTLMRRLARGDKFWQPHREHYYQRMVRSGLGHTYTAIVWYLIMVLGSILAVWALGRPPLLQWITAAAWVVVLLLLACVVDIRWRRFHSVSGERSEVTR